MMPEKVIVKEVEVVTRQPLNLRECGINLLNIERLTALIKCVLIAEVTMMGATPRNNNGIGNEI